MFLVFEQFSIVNRQRCEIWHPQGLDSWSVSDWYTAMMGEAGELGSLVKMHNRERDGLRGNKFTPTAEMMGKEIADVVIYADLLAQRIGINLGAQIRQKFNEVSDRNGFDIKI